MLNRSRAVYLVSYPSQCGYMLFPLYLILDILCIYFFDMATSNTHTQFFFFILILMIVQVNHNKLPSNKHNAKKNCVFFYVYKSKVLCKHLSMIEIDKEKKKDEKSVYFYFSQITRLMHFMDG